METDRKVFTLANGGELKLWRHYGRKWRFEIDLEPGTTFRSATFHTEEDARKAAAQLWVTHVRPTPEEIQIVMSKALDVVQDALPGFAIVILASPRRDIVFQTDNVDFAQSHLIMASCLSDTMEHTAHSGPSKN
jgi:hypothetical protein